MKILHILRAPIGGLFRHVCDLAENQIKDGHDVGFITAIPPDNDYVKKTFANIEPKLTLGISALNISRLPSYSDYKNINTIAQKITNNDIDIIHGHGAKGGAYARLIKKQFGKNSNIKTFYTLHGGTLHYSPTSPIGFVFLKLEKYLQKYTDGFIFESENSKRIFEKKIAPINKPFKTVHNGLKPNEFCSIIPNKDAANFLYIGELRMLKGVDLLINAFAKLCSSKTKKLKLIIIGYGPDEDLFKDMVAKLGIYDQVTFMPPMPAAEAFKLAKVQVMPSRAEGLPYMILETIAAKMPLIASHVGGIPEIYGNNANMLFESNNQEALYLHMQAALEQDSLHITKTSALQNYVKQNFCVDKMSNQITNFYNE